MGLHGPAAAGTAVADGVVAAQHGLLEKGVGHVPASVRGFHHGHGFIGRDAPAFGRVVLKHEVHDVAAHDDAHVQGQAGVFGRAPAGAVEQGQIGRIVQDDVAGQGVRQNLFRHMDVKGAVHPDQARDVRGRHDLAVVGVGKAPAAVALPPAEDAAEPGGRLAQDFRGQAPAQAGADIDLRPLQVHQPVQGFSHAGSGALAGGLPEGAGGRAETVQQKVAHHRQISSGPLWGRRRRRPVFFAVPARRGRVLAVGARRPEGKSFTNSRLMVEWSGGILFSPRR